MRLTIPDDLRPVIREIAAFFAGRSVGAFATGGFVRDVLLERDPHDVDIAVPGDTLTLGRALADELGGAFVALDEERGHVRIVLPEGDVFVDLTRYESDIETDLRRRDFTIDALAANLADLADGEAEVIDPTGGLADLEAKVVRATAEEPLQVDQLRVFRGVRIAAQLDFEIEPSTRELIARYAPRVGEAAPERQREELMRLCATDRAGPGLRMMDELGLLAAVLPELDIMRGVEQPKEHYYDVFGHALTAVSALDFILSEEEPNEAMAARLWRELWDQLAWWAGASDHFRERIVTGTTRRALLKICGLLHDIGKPDTKTFEESGRMRFFGHSDVGAEIAVRLMRRLRFSGREIEIIRRAIEAHLRPVQMAQERAPTKRAVYRYFRATGEAGIDTLFLSLADHLGTVGPNVRWDGWCRHVAVVSHILRLSMEDPHVVRPPRLINGDDLMREFGLEPGPLLGELLEYVREANAAGDVSTPEEALALVRTRLEWKR
jgi:poly(A) polymerase